MDKFKIENLDLYYGNFHALKNINLTIRAQRASRPLSGRPAAARSTLLKTLNRMNDLVEGCRVTGKVLLDGEDI